MRACEKYHGRLSMNEGDPGRVELAKLHNEGAKITVFLDGKEVTALCVMADSTIGEIERVKQDANGNFIIEGDTIVHEIVRGDVAIWIERKASPSRDIISMGVSR